MIGWQPKGLGDPNRLPENGVVVDVREHPIITVTIQGKLSDAQLEEYLACMDALGKGPRKKGVSIMVLSKAAPFTATQRKRQAEWINAQDPVRVKEDSLGAAFVISNPIIRGALHAIFWIAPPKHAYSIHGTVDEARKWAQEQLRQAGVAA